MLARWLLLSLALHLLGLLLFSFYPKSPSRRAEPPLDLESSIQILEPAPIGEPKSSHRLTSRKARPHPPRDLSLSDLGIQWSRDRAGPSIPAGGGGSARGDRYAYGSGGNDLLEQVKGVVVYREIRERIEEVLDYPDELQEAGIEGGVRATLFFTPQGEWSRRQSKVSARSAYLKIHILRVLRRAFTEPLPLTYFKEGLPVLVHCVFNFELVHKENPFIENPVGAAPAVGTVGNRFLFDRYAAMGGDWKLGPLAGSGLKPVVAIDPDWFVDKVAELIHPKAHEDPLRKYRHDPDWAP